MTERSFKLPTEYTPEEEAREGDRLIRIVIDNRLPAIEKALRSASSNYPNRDRLLELLMEFRALH